MTGVLINGDKCVLRDRGKTPGLITGCGTQVRILAQKVTVQDIHADGMWGFSVEAPAAVLRRNVATAPAGFVIFANRTRVLRSEARHGRDAGFFVASNDNVLRANLAEDNNNGRFTPGFELAGRNNKVQRNTARGNRVGFWITTWDLATVSRNIATGNDVGMWIRAASQVKVTRNTVTENGTRILVEDNSTSNLIRRNTATGNFTLDLEDQHGDCLSNTWRENTFVTASPTCIE